jgi:hypothetical protein
MGRFVDIDTERYEDTGCALWHACLSCPFPVCGEELPGGVDDLRRRLTYQVVGWLLEDGHSAGEVARRLGFTRRHVLRIKAALRRSGDVFTTEAFITGGRKGSEGAS